VLDPKRLASKELRVETKLKALEPNEYFSPIRLMDRKDSSADEDRSDGSSLESVDFEVMLKQEVMEMVSHALDRFKLRVDHLIKEHVVECHSDFEKWDAQMKATQNETITYVQEVHSSHVDELAQVKKEKDEQVLIN